MNLSKLTHLLACLASLTTSNSKRRIAPANGLGLDVGATATVALRVEAIHMLPEAEGDALTQKRDQGKLAMSNFP